MPISAKVESHMIQASWIRKMFEEGVRLKNELGTRNVFDFTLGNPILEPPEAVQRTLAELTSQPPAGCHRYMASAGYPEVRAAVADHLRRMSGLPFEAEDVIMTCGAAGGMNVALKSLLDPGDQVVVVAPFFPEYRFYVDNHGGELVVAESSQDFDLDLGALDRAIGLRTKAVLINSPNNPTGRMYSAERLVELGRLLADKQRRQGAPISLLSDEPYRKITFDGLSPPDTFAGHPHTVRIHSHSKDLGLPGERIGYAAISPHHADRQPLREAMTFANRSLGFVNAPALFQRVVAEALDESVPIDVYQQLRDLFHQGLAEAGIACFKPQGAFYLFPPSPLPDDFEFVRRLQQHRLLAVPGKGFARSGYIRLAFCVTRDEVERAIPIFAEVMREIRG